jgi:hypothetical protein
MAQCEITPMSRNPYHSENAEPALRRSVLAFFDILGYIKSAKDAYEAGTQAEMLKALYSALTGGRNWLEERYFGEEQKDVDEEHNKVFAKDRFAVKAFTDNIVIGWPIDDDAETELADAVGKLIDFQFHMAAAGFFVRGAIAIGDAYVDDVVVFGKALLDAHEAESTIARDPRIVLTQPAKEALKVHLTYYPHPQNSHHVRTVLRDADDQWFVNYLQAVLYAPDDVGPDSEGLLKHKLVVESKLLQFKSEPAIWSKYSWVAAYHNYFCDANRNWFDTSHKIDLELFRTTPGLIIDEG